MIEILFLETTFPPQDGDHKSKLILIFDRWDDFHYKTTFHLYFAGADKIIHSIGTVKIFDKSNVIESNDLYSTNYYVPTYDNLEKNVIQLNKYTCSLGQDLSYYANLKTWLPNEYLSVLERLNDIAFGESIRSQFINEDGVRVSLMRSSAAEKALNEASEITVGSNKDRSIFFNYKITMPYDNNSINLNFDFKKSKFLPYRINIIVGKNGTGKTQFLTKLANSLSGYTSEIEQDSFEGNRPPFDRVMSVSFSAFDDFRKPQSYNEDSVYSLSYVYCGIQTEEGTLSHSQLSEQLEKNCQIILKRNRQDIWTESINQLFQTEQYIDLNEITIGNVNKINLSSGQNILICTLTEIIANIEEESIILFDEPEIHLHPNAISNVMRVFYGLLDEFNSYAIFSTHSPIVLQEIPSKYIQIFDRSDDMFYIRRPNIECFGNNITDIISDVFDVSNLESNYKVRLQKLSDHLDFGEIRSLFNDNLSLNSLIFLKSIFRKSDEND